MVYLCLLKQSVCHRKDLTVTGFNYKSASQLCLPDVIGLVDVRRGNIQYQLGHDEHVFMRHRRETLIRKSYFSLC